jgi:tetratricopeptide (TPR) repeat protein
VGASGAEWSLSPAERVLVAGRIFWFYLSKLVWPVDLSFVYPRWPIDASRPWPYVFPVAGAALLVGLWRLRLRVGRGPLAAVLFYVVTLAPASGFFDVYPMQFSFVADHFQYLASLGPIALLCAAAVRGLGAAPLPRGRAVGAVAGGALLATLAAGTWRRTEVFQDQERLWRQALAVNPHAWLAANNLGGLLLRSGRPAEAIPWFEQAIAARPQYPEAHNNLGLALARTGRPAQAVDAYRRALVLDPSYTPARYNLGVALAATNDLVGAQHHLEWVVRLRPRDALALRDLGRVLALRGRLGEAVSALERAVALAPQDAFAAQQLDAVRTRSGEVGNERPHR